MRRTRLASLALCGASVVAGAGFSTSAAAVDVSVGEIHVTQGTQTTSAHEAGANSLPLIANRRTTVRAALSANGAATVTGRVHVSVDGQPVTPPDGVPGLNQPYQVGVPDLNESEGALVFEMPRTSVIAPADGANISNDVDVRVEITVPGGDDQPADNVGTVDDLTVERRVPPEIFYVPIRYEPAGSKLPGNSLIRPGVGDAAVRAMLPVDDSCPRCVYNRGMGTLTFDFSNNDNDTLDGLFVPGSTSSTTEGDVLIEELLALREVLVFPGGNGPTQATQIHAWLHPEVINGNLGKAELGGGASYSSTKDIDVYQQTIAHEIGHTLNRHHHTTGTLQPAGTLGWDSGGRLRGNPFGNGVVDRFWGSSTRPLMHPNAAPTEEAWNAPADWDAMRTFQQPGSEPRCPRRPAGTTSLIGHLDAGSGLQFFPEEAPLGLLRRNVREATLGNGFQLDFIPCLHADVRQALAIARVTYAPLTRTGRVENARPIVRRLPVDGRLITTPDPDAKQQPPAGRNLSLGPFSLEVPGIRGHRIQSIRITDTAGRRSLARLDRSRFAPRVDIVRPKPGATLRGRTTIVWSARDRDSSTRDLEFKVVYSPDRGRSWFPVDASIDGRTRRIVVDSRELPGSARRGLLRVYASDGLNTARAQVGGISVQGSRFTPVPARR